MKKLLSTISCLIKFKIQEPDPIRWKFEVLKGNFNTYQIHLTASIETNWRLFSQQSSDDGPLPIRIRFDENAFMVFVGKTNEVGNLKERFDVAFNVNTTYYMNVVDFVQKIKVYEQLRYLNGHLIYMACSDKYYGNPKKIEFTLELE